jgi:hypothetical protein
MGLEARTPKLPQRPKAPCCVALRRRGCFIAPVTVYRKMTVGTSRRQPRDRDGQPGNRKPGRTERLQRLSAIPPVVAPHTKPVFSNPTISLKRQPRESPTPHRAGRVTYPCRSRS